jgi:regulator of protease activity HflC (stomatin/prohibitin superfamily)
MFISLLLIATLLATWFAAAVKRVPAGQVYSLYRQGKPSRLLQPGVHVVLPLEERVVNKINLSGQVLRFEEPMADAGDVSGTVYWQVLEPERADAVFGQVDQLILRGTVHRTRPGARRSPHAQFAYEATAQPKLTRARHDGDAGRAGRGMTSAGAGSL